MPCLSFVWEVTTPPSWRAADCGSGLFANDPETSADWPFVSLGLGRPDWTFLSRHGRRLDADVLRVLDLRLVDLVSDELTFAEWFCRWDAGPWPIVVDRISLSSAGYGPKSACVPSRVKNEAASVSLATLKRYGLALVPIEGVFVITTDGERQRLAKREGPTAPCAEALLWGSDRTDRFQTPARWRGEPSPRLRPRRGRRRRWTQTLAWLVRLAVLRTELAKQQLICIFDRCEAAHLGGMDFCSRVPCGLARVSALCGSLSVSSVGDVDGGKSCDRLARSVTVCEPHRRGLCRRACDLALRAGQGSVAQFQRAHAALGPKRRYGGSGPRPQARPFSAWS